MNMQQMLGESGRTMSNEDRQIMDMMMRKSNPVSPPQRMPMPDNEPRMGDRSPANQMFSIESEISNLMKSYNMLVEAQEFDRAQQVANMIDQLQQQKIQIQNQNAPFMLKEGNLGLNPDAGMRGTQAMMGESGRTMSNTDRDEISRILDSISI